MHKMPIATATMISQPLPTLSKRRGLSNIQQHQPGPSIHQRAIDTESPPPDPADEHLFTLTQVYDPSIRCTYDVGDYLGKGGFASCYTVTDRRTRCQYALKVIDKRRLRKLHHREKVDREIDIHQRLRHDNIVRMYSSFEDAQYIYMVLELCQKKSLVNFMHSRGLLNERDAAECIRQLLYAVIYLHEDVRILHRDLKLGNMLLTDQLTVKLADFGLATAIDDLNRRDSSSSSICGTPNYIAPEVLQKKGHSPATESWAVGCVLYALIFGRPPFETDNLEKTYKRIERGDFSYPSHIPISRDAHSLIESLLTVNPTMRLLPRQALDHPFLRVHTRCVPTNRVLFPAQPQTYTFDANGAVLHDHAAIAMRTANSCRTRNGNTPPAAQPTPASHQSRRPSSRHLSTAELYCLSDEVAHIPEVPLVPTVEYVEDWRTSPPSTPPPLTLMATTSPTSDHRQQHQSVRRQSSYPIRRGSVSTGSADSGIGGSDHQLYIDNQHGRMLSVYASMLASLVETNNNNDMASGSRTVLTPSTSQHPLLYIAKWVDYTNKYGFGCTLNDGTVSVLYNDMSSLSASCDQTCFQHMPHVSRPDAAQRWSSHDACPPDLHDAVELAVLFDDFMSRRLVNGGELAVNEPIGDQRHLPYLVRYRRDDKYVFMMLNDGTVQVNFNQEHIKLVLSIRGQNVVLLTIIDANRRSTSYQLNRTTLDQHLSSIRINGSMCRLFQQTTAIIASIQSII